MLSAKVLSFMSGDTVGPTPTPTPEAAIEKNLGTSSEPPNDDAQTSPPQTS